MIWIPNSRTQVKKTRPEDRYRISHKQQQKHRRQQLHFRFSLIYFLVGIYNAPICNIPPRRNTTHGKQTRIAATHAYVTHKSKLDHDINQRNQLWFIDLFEQQLLPQQATIYRTAPKEEKIVHQPTNAISCSQFDSFSIYGR